NTTTVADSLTSILESDGLSVETLSNSEISEVVSALLNKDGSTDDILQRLKNAHRLQLININKLVKTIKAVVEELIRAVDDIRDVSKKIRWTPLPSEKGPEEGCDITNLVIPKQKSKLETRILNLEIRALQSSDIGSLSNDLVNSDFYMAQFENTEKA